MSKYDDAEKELRDALTWLAENGYPRAKQAEEAWQHIQDENTECFDVLDTAYYALKEPEVYDIEEIKKDCCKVLFTNGVDENIDDSMFD
jgi:hypothetical protein